jgi:hypothetical protein
MINKRIKYYGLGICALLSMGVFAKPSPAQNQVDVELVRERTLAFEIFGINARMTTEKIIKTLKAQGFKSVYPTTTGWRAKFENDQHQSFELVAPRRKTLADSPWEVLSMKSTHGGVYLPVCDKMIEEYNKLCDGLYTEFGPCYLRDSGVYKDLMLALLDSNYKKSSDGYMYKTEVRVQKQQYCSYTIERRTK